MKEISVGYVKHVLGNKKEILAYGRERIKELYEELNNTDFCVHEVAYVKILNDQSKVSSSNRNADISDVLMKQKKFIRSRYKTCVLKLFAFWMRKNVYTVYGFVLMLWIIRGKPT